MTSSYADGWALVVGIDAYDDPNIQDLGGAVRDACEAVTWLRNAGVPDDHILLNAQPTEASRPLLESLGPGVAWRDASERDIAESVSRLRAQTGSHLFVFLVGHGIYDPSAKRLFITKEASGGDFDVFSNLAVEEYIELFLSMSFPEQLLVMDGCQNVPYGESERSKIPAGMPFAGFNAKAGNTLVFCFACQQGEQAVEVEGRGLFLKHLLAAIDTRNPSSQILHLDFDSGDVSIDLRKAVTDAVGPVVKEIAWAQRPRIRQEPGVQVYGAGTARNVWPLHLPPTPAARLSIAVKPASAVRDVEAILVQVEGPPYWSRVAPVPPSRTVQVPFENRLPHETSLSVKCRLKSTSTWRKPAERRLRIDESDREVVFALRKAQAGENTRRSTWGAGDDGTAWVFVEGVDAGGRPDSSAIRNAVRSIGGNTPGSPPDSSSGIEVTRKDGGLFISGRYDDRERLAQFASRVATTLALAAPEGVSATISDSPVSSGTAVRIVLPDGGPEPLVGSLVNTPVISVGQLTRTVRAIETDPLVGVQPGHVEVRVDLPWGSWSDVVEVFEGIEKDVHLPHTVGNGLVPLRVGIRADVWEGLPGCSVLGFGPRPTKAMIHGNHHGSSASLQTLPGSDGWLLTAHPEDSTWGTCVSLPDTDVTFPLHPSLPLALDGGEGAAWVEPLSTIPVPEWDELVSLGRLGGHEPRSLLDADKGWAPDPVLTLARAYACYAAGADTYTRRILGLLRRRGVDMCDIAVLEGMTALRSGGSAPKAARSALAPWAEAETVPVLRWGVAPAIALAEELNLHAWHTRLETVEASLSPNSVWSVWRTP
ncbi:caspase family protein [Streptomyces sp. NPDC006553]|uniref:caspase family protein n=1 Tax=unclassified Streptomyces TaxID=2593676 RepID=UPI0022554B5C|nr:caspase family protein [Streptomyces sp. NBC_00233]MCX5232000.1 caspase family protein [Streptomyces sp. NBC_00233]